MPGYLRKNNVKLEALLQARGLPLGGSKSQMAQRLKENDKKKKEGSTTATLLFGSMMEDILESDESVTSEDSTKKESESDLAILKTRHKEAVQSGWCSGWLIGLVVGIAISEACFLVWRVFH